MVAGSDKAAKDAEISGNYRAFQKQLPGLMPTHQGKFALLRHGRIVEFFDTARDALAHAIRTYDDGLYSVQEVTDRVVDLGWFSRFGHAPSDPAI